MRTSFALATLLFALTVVAAPVADAEFGLETRDPHHHHYDSSSPSPAPAAAPAPAASSSGGDSAPNSDEQSVLDAHNSYRAMHSADPLTWNSDLASYAASHASSCVFEHTYGPYGENLAAGYPSASAAVDAWYNEISDYDFNNPGFSEVTGHFTQVVWVGSSEVGCAYVSCNTADTPGNYLMCEYSPPGNVLGYFSENVFAS